MQIYYYLQFLALVCIAVKCTDCDGGLFIEGLLKCEGPRGLLRISCDFESYGVSGTVDDYNMFYYQKITLPVYRILVLIPF